MKTRIEKPEENLVSLKAVPKGHLIAIGNLMFAYQRCGEVDDLISVHCMESCDPYQYNPEIEVHLITVDDLIKGSWRIKERKPITTQLGNLAHDEYFHLPQGEFIWIAEGFDDNYTDCWNHTLGFHQKKRMSDTTLVVHLKHTSVDPDGTEVFREL